MALEDGKAKRPSLHSVQQRPLRVSPANPSHPLPLYVGCSMLGSSSLQALQTPPDFPDSTWLLLSRPQWGSYLQNQLEQVEGSPVHCSLLPDAPTAGGSPCHMPCVICQSLGVCGAGRVLYLPFHLSNKQGSESRMRIS